MSGPKWVNRSSQAMQEAAEAVGTSTELVMAVAHAPDGAALVLFTPGLPDDQTVWAARLERDPHGILTEVAREAKPGLWEEMQAGIERALWPKVGQRVELHPGTDRWMRGDRYGVVTGVYGDAGLIEVAMDRSRQVIRARRADIGRIVD